MCSFSALETRLSKDDRLAKRAVDFLNSSHQFGRRQIVRQGVVLVEPDVVQRVPKPRLLEVSAKIGSIRERTGIAPAHAGNDFAPFAFVMSEVHKLNAYTKKISINLSCQISIMVDKRAIFRKPLHAVLLQRKIQIAGELTRYPYLRFQKHPHGTLVCHDCLFCDHAVAFPSTWKVNA